MRTPLTSLTSNGEVFSPWELERPFFFVSSAASASAFVTAEWDAIKDWEGDKTLPLGGSWRRVGK